MAPSNRDNGQSNPDWSTVERERALLVQHFALILKHRDFILSRPDLRSIAPLPAGLSLAYIDGSGQIPIGALLNLWARNDFIGRCPACNGSTKIFFAAGSVLSGSNHWWGICETCGAGKQGSFSDEEQRSRPLFDRVRAAIDAREALGRQPNNTDIYRQSGGMTVDGRYCEVQLESSGSRQSGQVGPDQPPEAPGLEYLIDILQNLR